MCACDVCDVCGEEQTIKGGVCVCVCVYVCVRAGTWDCTAAAKKAAVCKEKGECNQSRRKRGKSRIQKWRCPAVKGTNNNKGNQAPKIMAAAAAASTTPTAKNSSSMHNNKD